MMVALVGVGLAVFILLVRRARRRRGIERASTTVAEATSAIAVSAGEGLTWSRDPLTGLRDRMGF